MRTIVESSEETVTGSATRTRPVVLIPGFEGAHRGWTLLRRRLERAGFHDVGTVDRLPTDVDVPHRADRLARHVETLRSLTGAESVHLVGHNIGGIVARYYVQVLGGDHATESVTSIGTAHGGTRITLSGTGSAAAQLRPGSSVMRHIEESTRPMRVTFLNYFSDRDVFVDPVGSAMLREPALRATNILVTGHGNLSVTLPAQVARSIAHEIATRDSTHGHGAAHAALPGVVVHLDGEHTRAPATLASA